MTALTHTQRVIIIILVLMVVFSFVGVLNQQAHIRELEEAQDKIIEYIGRGR